MGIDVKEIVIRHGKQKEHVLRVGYDENPTSIVILKNGVKK